MPRENRQLARSKTVAQAAYENLRGAILEGARAPGEKLNQDTLAADLGVSRMPVREALSRLEAEGLIVFETYRGAFVKPLSADELEQIYLMRLALEPLLARLAAGVLESAHIENLAAIQQGMAQALAAGDTQALFERVRAFHETLYEAAGKPLILAQILGLRDRAQRYIRRYLTLPGRLAHVVENHADILAAARRGDAPAVERLIHEELVTTREALLASLAIDM
jgi:GntR family transcriptional regulator, rspAB operon transcriptional repressor